MFELANCLYENINDMNIFIEQAEQDFDNDDNVRSNENDESFYSSSEYESRNEEESETDDENEIDLLFNEVIILDNTNQVSISSYFKKNII